MNIRLLVVVSRYNRNQYDPGDFVTELSQWINDDKNIQVFVLAPHDNGLKFKEKINGINIFRFPYFFPYRFQKVAYGPGILDNLKKSFFAKVQVPFFIVFEFFYTLKIIKKLKINFLHSHWIIPQGFIGALCSKIYKIPHIATVHGSDINMVKSNFILSKVIAFTIKNTSSITVNSLYTKKRVQMFFSLLDENKIKTIPMGIDLDRFHFQLNQKLRNSYDEKNILLFVGRLIDWKGVRYLIEALKIVTDKFCSTRLLIIGSGPEKLNLTNLVDKLNLGNNVSFLGEIDNTKMKDYYSVADIFIIPSISVDGHKEGLGVVTIEAMACGAPAIGTNSGGIPDVIIDNYNGFLVPEKSSKVLGEKIITLLNNKNLINNFSKNGLKTVKEKFTWNVISQKFIKIIYKNFNQELS